MKYSEILNDVLDGKWVRPHDDHKWIRLREDGLWEVDPPTFQEPDYIKAESFRRSTWEVKHEDIYVWGVCHENGESNLCSKKPIWNGPRWQPDEFVNDHHLKSNLFPKDKPQKYKLIPVEEEL